MSQWKIEDGSLWVKHPSYKPDEWINCKNDPDDKAMVAILEGELAVRRMIED